MGYSTSYNFMWFIFFVFFVGYMIQAIKRRQARERARRMNMNPGLAALARQPAAPVITYTTVAQPTVPVAVAVPIADGTMGMTAPQGDQSAIPVAYAATQL